jgi:hypothetical protein
MYLQCFYLMIEAPIGHDDGKHGCRMSTLVQAVDTFVQAHDLGDNARNTERVILIARNLMASGQDYRFPLTQILPSCIKAVLGLGLTHDMLSFILLMFEHASSVGISPMKFQASLWQTLLAQMTAHAASSSSSTTQTQNCSSAPQERGLKISAYLRAVLNAILPRAVIESCDDVFLKSELPAATKGAPPPPTKARSKKSAKVGHGGQLSVFSWAGDGILLLNDALLVSFRLCPHDAQQAAEVLHNILHANLAVHAAIESGPLAGLKLSGNASLMYTKGALEFLRKSFGEDQDQLIWDLRPLFSFLICGAFQAEIKEIFLLCKDQFVVEEFRFLWKELLASHESIDRSAP